MEKMDYSNQIRRENFEQRNKEFAKKFATKLYESVILARWPKGKWKDATISRSDVVRLIKDYQSIGGLSSIDISVDGTEDDPVIYIQSRSSVFCLDDFIYLKLILLEEIPYGRIHFSPIEVSNGIVKCEGRKIKLPKVSDNLMNYLMFHNFGNDYFLSMLRESLEVLEEYLNFGHSRIAKPYVLVKRIIEAFPKQSITKKKRKNIVRSIYWWFSTRFKTIEFIIKNRSIYLYHFSDVSGKEQLINSYGLLSLNCGYIYAFVKGKQSLIGLSRSFPDQEWFPSVWRINILGLPCPVRDSWMAPNAEPFFVPVSHISPWRIKYLGHVDKYEGLDFLGAIDLYMYGNLHKEVILHAKRIINFGRYLAKQNGANMNVVILFAALHDSEKKDTNNPEHGAMAAKKIGDFYHYLFYNLSSQEKESVKKACELHSTEIKTGDVTIDTCIDANRLEIGRYGIEYDIEKFATEEGRKLAQEYSGKYLDLVKMTEII